ncbi:MAG: LysR family transcriptional regulator [Lacunisphaera sp.]
MISQPSLSQQILNLEEELGQQLFHRLGRKAVLTESGKTLLEGARRILGDVDQTLHELKESNVLGPKVTVGAIPTVAPFLFPALIAHCRASEILLDIHTQEDFRRPLAESVLEGRLDWALISLPFNEPRLHIEKLYSEPLWGRHEFQSPSGQDRTTDVRVAAGRKLHSAGGKLPP